MELFQLNVGPISGPIRCNNIERKMDQTRVLRLVFLWQAMKAKMEGMVDLKEKTLHELQVYVVNLLQLNLAIFFRIKGFFFSFSQSNNSSIHSQKVQIIHIFYKYSSVLLYY